MTFAVGTLAPPARYLHPFLRAQNNLDNLGSLMQDVGLDVTSWEEREASLKTKWRFRCVLGLPWKPTLAAAGVSISMRLVGFMTHKPNQSCT